MNQFRHWLTYFRNWLPVLETGQATYRTRFKNRPISKLANQFPKQRTSFKNWLASFETGPAAYRTRFTNRPVSKLANQFQNWLVTSFPNRARPATCFKNWLASFKFSVENSSQNQNTSTVEYKFD
jgi:hypothetical protein